VKVNTVLMRDVNHHQLDTFWRGSSRAAFSCVLLS
jgi:molybdenum cofactor biosynthesis enzyme MoaA